ncbi:MAG: hypothetical protein FD153_514 [Rhodospirillaceae bacterium]|nr:MAG: hypothetical protein FD153_514 [Rhodospirillaceae bacterium]
MTFDLPLLRPFAALRPLPLHAAAVIAPPYDVLDIEDARAIAAGRPYSFLHISKAEIDLPPGTDPYAPAVYAKAAENLNRLMAEGILVRESKPCFYIYRLIAGSHIQTGIVGAATVAAYDSGRIRRHEFTRPGKEDDRVRQIEAVNAHTGPVLAAYRPTLVLAAVITQVAAMTPLFAVTADDGVTHVLWQVARETDIVTLSAAFATLPALYIADGHHRSAAASRVAAARRTANPDHRGDEMYNSLLLVSFPADEMVIRDYNRVVRDLNGLDRATFLARVAEVCTVTPSSQPVRPAGCGEMGLYLPGQWYRLAWRAMPLADPVARLDVSLLTARILQPVLGLADLRQDQRIGFVGGGRGLGTLAEWVDSGKMAVAFAMHPPSLEALIAVTETGQVMPPKSTWFEPKLADGLLSLPLAWEGQEC